MAWNGRWLWLSALFIVVLFGYPFVHGVTGWLGVDDGPAFVLPVIAGMAIVAVIAWRDAPRHAGAFGMAGLLGLIALASVLDGIHPAVEILLVLAGAAALLPWTRLRPWCPGLAQVVLMVTVGVFVGEWWDQLGGGANAGFGSAVPMLAAGFVLLLGAILLAAAALPLAPVYRLLTAVVVQAVPLAFVEPFFELSEDTLAVLALSHILLLEVAFLVHLWDVARERAAART